MKLKEGDFIKLKKTNEIERVLFIHPKTKFTTTEPITGLTTHLLIDLSNIKDFIKVKPHPRWVI